MIWQIINTGFIDSLGDNITYTRSFPTLLKAVRHISGDAFTSYINGLASAYQNYFDEGRIKPVLLYNGDIYVSVYFQYTAAGNLKLHLKTPPARWISTMCMGVYAVVRATGTHGKKEFYYTQAASPKRRMIPIPDQIHYPSVLILEGDGKAVRDVYQKFMAMRVPPSEKGKNLHIANHVGDTDTRYGTNPLYLASALHGACLRYPWIPATYQYRGMINARVAKIVGGLFVANDTSRNIALHDALLDPSFYDLFTDDNVPYAIEPTAENTKWVRDNGAKWYIHENKIALVDQRLATLHKVGYS